MVTSKIDDQILWLYVEGDLVANEVINEHSKWVSNEDKFIGMITDIRKMNPPSILEQKKLEQQRKQNGLNKPHAILGKDNAFAALVNIYVRFTNAKDTRYFTTAEEAVSWLKK